MAEYNPDEFFSAERHTTVLHVNGDDPVAVKMAEAYKAGYNQALKDVKTFKRKPQSNADRITASIDKLIEWYCRHRDCGTCDYGHEIDCTLRDWLRQEVDNGGPE